MKSPNNDFNGFIYFALGVFGMSVVVAFVFGMWVGVRLQ